MAFTPPELLGLTPHMTCACTQHLHNVLVSRRLTFGKLSQQHMQEGTASVLLVGRAEVGNAQRSSTAGSMVNACSIVLPKGVPCGRCVSQPRRKVAADGLDPLLLQLRERCRCFILKPLVCQRARRSIRFPAD